MPIPTWIRRFLDLVAITTDVIVFRLDNRTLHCRPRVSDNYCCRRLTVSRVNAWFARSALGARLSSAPARMASLSSFSWISDSADAAAAAAAAAGIYYFR